MVGATRKSRAQRGRSANREDTRQAREVLGLASPWVGAARALAAVLVIVTCAPAPAHSFDRLPDVWQERSTTVLRRVACSWLDEQSARPIGYPRRPEVR